MQMTMEKIDGEREMLISEAFTVATCARELGDMETAIVALRVIDDLLHKRTPAPADVQTLKTYFR